MRSVNCSPSSSSKNASARYSNCCTYTALPHIYKHIKSVGVWYDVYKFAINSADTCRLGTIFFLLYKDDTCASLKPIKPKERVV